MRRSLHALMVLAAVLLLAAPVAVAKRPIPAGNPVLTDCNQHGTLTHHYTAAQLHHALAVMPTWMKQYTNCQSTIQTALNSNTGSLVNNGPGAGGGGGSSISTGLIIAIVVVVVAVAAFAWLLIRRRRALGGGHGPASTGGGGA